MKKGFTLAEILGVIVIVGILLVLIVPAVINRITESEDEVKGATGNIIYNAADQYIKEHPDLYPPGQSGRYCITIKSLIEDGKLVEPVIDPSTGEDISDKSVMVTIYTAGTSDFELTEKDTCEEIASVSFIDFDVTPKGSSWVKQRTVKIIWPKMDGDYKARYRIDNGEWIYVDDINSYNGGTTEIIFNKSSAKTPLEAQYVGKGEDATSITDSRINIVNIDSVAPKCNLRVRGTMGDNSWYVSNVTVDFGDNRKNLTDDLSGVDDYGISIISSNTFGKISSRVQSVDTPGITYYGYVIDKAGNIGKCNTSFKRDATKPVCVMSESGTKGDNNWYISNVKFDVVNSDNLSGVAQHGMNNKNTVRYDSAITMTLSTDTKNITYYGFVKDNAGNTNQCSRTVKRDVTKPICTVSSSGTAGDNGWYRGNITMTLSQYTDATSGIATFGLKNNSSVSYNKTTKLTQTADTGGITYYGFVKDNAGHENVCKKTVKKDTVKPTCSVSITGGTMGNNGWYRSNVTFSMSSSDSLSGVWQRGMNSGSSTTYNGYTSMTLSRDTSGITYYGFVKDYAGNTNSCSRWAKRDATAPTVSFGINGHFSGTISCSDSMSGVSGSRNWSTSLGGNANKTVSATCRDNAGNSRTSSHTYKYSSCKYTENTCQGGYDKVWDNCATKEWVGCMEQDCYVTSSTNCIANGGTNMGPAGTGINCCKSSWNSHCKQECRGGYKDKYNSCKYGSPNECRPGFSL